MRNWKKQNDSNWIVVTPEQLRLPVRPGTWRADEKLPPDFFERLREETGCQAIFFNQLTRYEPYQPVAIGWKMTLVVDKDQLDLLGRRTKFLTRATTAVCQRGASIRRNEYHFGIAASRSPTRSLSSPEPIRPIYPGSIAFDVAAEISFAEREL